MEGSAWNARLHWGSSRGNQRAKASGAERRGGEDFLLIPQPKPQSRSPPFCPRERAIRLLCGSGEKRPAGEADQGQREGPAVVQPGEKLEVS